MELKANRRCAPCRAIYSDPWRVDIERGIVPALGFKNGAKKKCMPFNVDTMRERKGFDSHRGGIRIRAREIEPELKRHCRRLK